jgi:hypothetical protein
VNRARSRHRQLLSARIYVTAILISVTYKVEQLTVSGAA